MTVSDSKILLRKYPGRRGRRTNCSELRNKCDPVSWEAPLQDLAKMQALSVFGSCSFYAPEDRNRCVCVNGHFPQINLLVSRPCPKTDHQTTRARVTKRIDHQADSASYKKKSHQSRSHGNRPLKRNLLVFQRWLTPIPSV